MTIKHELTIRETDGKGYRHCNCKCGWMTGGSRMSEATCKELYEKHLPSVEAMMDRLETGLSLQDVYVSLRDDKDHVTVDGFVDLRRLARAVLGIAK